MQRKQHKTQPSTVNDANQYKNDIIKQTRTSCASHCWGNNLLQTISDNDGVEVQQEIHSVNNEYQKKPRGALAMTMIGIMNVWMLSKWSELIKGLSV